MDYKVVYSARAGHDLAAIVAFLADKNPGAAKRLGHDLLDAADALSLMPYRGPAMRGRPQFRKLSHPPHHVIIYQVNEHTRTVEILRFWDARQNPNRLQLP